MKLTFFQFNAFAAMALVLGACGSSANTAAAANDTAASAGDTQGTPTDVVADDAAAKADTLASDTIAGASALTVACPFGIALVQHPIKNPLDPAKSEGAFGGTVSVKRGSADVETATVTVNGVALNYTSNGDYEVPNTAAIPGAVAGATLKLAVKDGADSVAFDVVCPTEVAFAAPADDTAVSPGDALQVQWTGVLDYKHPLLTPGLGLYKLDAPSGTFLGYGPASQPKILPTDTSATLTLPPNDKPQYVVELQVPGTFVKTAKYDGVHCTLVRRLMLTTKP